MAQLPKVPLKNLQIIPEISPRDTSLAGTKAASGVQATARQKQFEAMVHGIRLWDDKEGKVGSVKGFGGLIVAEPPADLPVKYRRNLKAGQLIVVDGVQRYRALLETKGEDCEVAVKPVTVQSMTDLRRLAFEYNFQPRYHLPLTQEEIWAHYLRDELGGHHRGLTRKAIGQKFGGWIKDDYLKTWGKVAAQVRSFLRLDDKHEAEIKQGLKSLVNSSLSAIEPPQFDVTGYPDKLQLRVAIDIAENGLPDPDDEIARWDKREASRLNWENSRKAKAIDALRELGFDDPYLVRSLAEMLEAKKEPTVGRKAVTRDSPPDDFLDDDEA
jgi:hypothetical protein